MVIIIEWFKTAIWLCLCYPIVPCHDPAGNRGCYFRSQCSALKGFILHVKCCNVACWNVSSMNSYHSIYSNSSYITNCSLYFHPVWTSRIPRQGASESCFICMIIIIYLVSTKSQGSSEGFLKLLCIKYNAALFRKNGLYTFVDRANGLGYICKK